jgi:hypothetical protein
MSSPTIVLSVEGFRIALSAVLPAVSRDTTRPHLVRALFQAQGGTCNVVGTDGHVMAIAEVPCESEGSVAVPREVCEAALKASRKLAGDVTITETTLAFCGQSWSFDTSNACPFPPWRQVVPPIGVDTLPRSVGLNAELLCRASGAFEAARKAGGGKVANTVLMLGARALDPVMVKSDNAWSVPITWIIMPWRLDGPEQPRFVAPGSGVRLAA